MIITFLLACIIPKMILSETPKPQVEFGGKVYFFIFLNIKIRNILNINKNIIQFYFKETIPLSPKYLGGDCTRRTTISGKNYSIRIPEIVHNHSICLNLKNYSPEK